MANLIEKLKYAGGAISLIWVIVSLVFIYRRIPFPKLFQQSISMIAVIAICGFGVILIGPVKVFYQLHEWVFPDNHQWFFYYQESLMTILMKAPDLFGGIAILLIVLATVLFITLNYCLCFIQKGKWKVKKGAH